MSAGAASAALASMITPKIERLAQAIKIAEGWGPLAPSLTYRNHNPGALKHSPFQVGHRDGFAVFSSDDTGFFALCWDLMKKCQGKTRTKLGPDSTLQDLVKIYTAETDPLKLENYLSIIESVTGRHRTIRLKYFIT